MKVTPPQKRQFGHTSKFIEKDVPIALPLVRGDKLSALNYMLALSINYTVTTATQTMSDFEFLENVISNINLEIGAGVKRVDLPITEHMLINLLNRGFLSCQIPKTVGTHTAKVNLIIDMTLVNMQNPKDSIFHTFNYDHRLINVHGGQFDRYPQVAINTANVVLIETLKHNVSPNLQTLGENVIDFNIMKKPILSTTSIKGTQEIEVDFPENKKVLGCLIYAIEGDTSKIEGGCLDKIVIENSSAGKYNIDHSLQNQINRQSKIFDTATNAYFNNVCYFDFAEGQLSEAIHTKRDSVDSDTKLKIMANENGLNNPKLKVLFLCVDKA